MFSIGITYKYKLPFSQLQIRNKLGQHLFASNKIKVFSLFI